MADSSVRVVFLGESASAVRSVNALGRSFGSLGNAAKLATRAMTIGVIGALGVAVKEAIAFDKAMRNVNSIAKLSEKQFQGMSKQILALAKVSGQAPTTLAKGMYDIVSSGFKANQAIKILRVSSIAATAGLTDTATATKAVVAVLNAYHLSANKAARVGDILFQTVNKGVLTFEELAAQIGDVLPVAAQLGVPLEDIGGALATITLHGVNAAEAATQLKQVLVSTLKPSESLQKQIKQMGFDTGEAALKTLGLEGFLKRLTVASHGSAAAFADWFPNVRAMNGALGLTGKNIATLHDNIKAMNERGALGAAFAEQGKSISVQWQKAKASLIAAAIPIGQLLFPALKAGAEKVGEFAAAVEAHMPMIKAQFADLASAAQGLASGLAAVGSSREGQIAIASLASGFAGGKAASGALGLVAAIRGLGGVNPIIALTAGAFALLGGAIFANQTKVSALEGSLLRAVAAAMQLSGALNQQAHAHLAVRQATTNLQTATMQLQASQILATRAAREFGAGSQQHKQALLSVRQASDNLAAAKLALKDATKLASKADEDATVKARAHKQALAGARAEAQSAIEKFGQYDDQLRGASAGTIQLSQDSLQLARQLKSDAARDYANAIAAITRALGGSQKKADAARAAVVALAQTLGRLPTMKEVNIFIRTHGSVQPQTGSTVGGKIPGHAHGDFVRGAPGSPQVILAHGGELVLNRQQQNVLGGPGFLKSLFGFSGDGGPSFARGGVVGRRGLKRSKPSPWRKLRSRAKASSGAAREALSAVDAVNQSETNLDRMYGQLAREFDISQENFLVDGPDGGQVLDGAAVAQRVSELDRLAESRTQMLALIDLEKLELQRAIERLREAIAKLQAAIRAEVRAANADAAAIRRLEGKKKRTKADDRQLERLRASETSHRSLASTYDSRVQEFTGALKGAQSNLANELPFDRRDVELDLMELGAQRTEVLAIRPAPATGGGGGDTGGGGGGGDGGSIADFVGGGGAIVGPDLSQALADALAQLGQLRLALGLEAVQLPIIGAFAKGTLNVPSEGLAYVHAGESISARGVRSPGASGDDGGYHVIDLDLGEQVNSMLSAREVQLTDKIIVRLGSEIDRRRRGGRA